jgi:hypothetical protein
MFKKKIAALAGILIAATTFTFPSAAAAEAVALRCPSPGLMCAYFATNYGGGYETIRPGTGTNWCKNVLNGISRSGSNAMTLNLTVSDQPCGRAGRAAILYAGTETPRFPWGVQSVSYCGSCLTNSPSKAAALGSTLLN